MNISVPEANLGFLVKCLPTPSNMKRPTLTIMGLGMAHR